MIVQVRRPIGAKRLAWLVNVEGRKDFLCSESCPTVTCSRRPATIAAFIARLI